MQETVTLRTKSGDHEVALDRYEREAAAHARTLSASWWWAPTTYGPRDHGTGRAETWTGAYGTGTFAVHAKPPAWLCNLAPGGGLVQWESPALAALSPAPDFERRVWSRLNLSGTLTLATRAWDQQPLTVLEPDDRGAKRPYLVLVEGQRRYVGLNLRYLHYLCGAHAIPWPEGLRAVEYRGPASGPVGIVSQGTLVGIVMPIVLGC